MAAKIGVWGAKIRLRINGDMDYVGDEGDVAKMKDVFERIFKVLNQEQHYNMMMSRR